MATARLQLSVRAEGLKNRRVRSWSDPYAVVAVTGGVHDGTTIGRTETLQNSLSPDWAKKFVIDFYRPGVFTPITISVYDDREGDGRGENRLMDACTFEVAEVLDSPGREVAKTLESAGTVFLHIDESIKGDAYGVLRFHFRGLDIKNIEKGLLQLGVADPFFEVSRKFSDYASGIARWVTVYRSETIKDTLNPFWEEAQLPLEELCHRDLDWPLRVSVLDWEKNGKHRPIGSFETTANQLMASVAVRGNADREKAFPLWQTEREPNTDPKIWGRIVVLSAEIVA